MHVSLQNRPGDADELAAVKHELEVHQEELYGQLEELKRTQGLLEASRDEYVELYDFAPVTYMTVDGAGIIRAINLTGCKLLEVERKRLIGARFAQFVREPFRANWLDHLRRCRADAPEVTSELELELPTWKRIPVIVLTRHSPDTGFRTIVFDCTERARLDGTIRQLNVDRVVAAEDERRRIARELHDEMGQQVAALIMDLRSIENALPPDSELRSRLRHSQEMADQIGREVHDLALELRPTALDDLGLYAALAQYLKNWSTRSGVATDLHADSIRGHRLPPNIETALYRIVQEALTNVAKHAHASHANVVIEKRDSEVLAIIEDNGRGFVVEQSQQPVDGRPRLGLAGMRERLASLRGSLEIESAPGEGATVFARVPLSQFETQSPPPLSPRFRGG